MSDESKPAGTGAARRSWVRFLPLAVLFGAMAAVFGLGLHRYLSLDAIITQRHWLKSFVAAHSVYAVLLFGLVYVVAVALSVPGAVVLTLLGGFLFGWFVGGAVTVVAATLGATIVFLVARTSLGAALAEKAGPALGRLSKGFQHDAVSYMLFLRLVPLFPFWLVNLAPALFGVRLPAYVMSTLVGILPGTFAFSVAGAGLDSLIEAQQTAYASCVAAGRPGCVMKFDPRALVTPEILAAFAALGVVSLIPVAIRRFAGKKLAALDEAGPLS